MKIQSRDIKILSIDKIVPNPKNRNQHSKEQIQRLKKLIEFQGFRNPLIISNRTGFLVVGHGRLEAAKELGMTELPVIYQDFESEAQEYSYLISDNEIARWAELDLEGLSDDLKEIELEDIDLLGIEDFELPSIDESEGEDLYTQKVESPLYEPSGEVYKAEDLYDVSKTKSLIDKIEKSNISDSEKIFLRNAAYRHSAFNYKKIADYYAGASKEVQELMEESGLVIVDFEKAIELGFVQMTEKFAEAYNAK